MRSLFFVISFFCYSILANAQTGADCSTSILLQSNGCSTAGQYNNTGIAGTLAAPSCFTTGTNNGMWFRFVATQQTVVITANAGTLTGIQMALISSSNNSCTGAFTEIGCASATAPTVLTYSALTVGNVYYIYVDGRNNRVGTFQMCLSSPAVPFNDNPCNAASIPALNFCSNVNSFTNVGATSESLFSATIPSCWDAAGTQNTVWFTYTAIGAGNTIQVIGGGTGGLQRPQVIVLQASNCAGTTWTSSAVACGQAASGVNSITINANNLIAGQTYLIGVDGHAGNTGAFQLCVNSFVPTSTVPNDLCSGAYSICPNQIVSGSTAGATNTGDVPIGDWNCNGVLDNAVWFSFRTAATVNPISIAISGSCTPWRGTGPPLIQFEVFNYTGTGNVCSGTNVNLMTSIACDATISGTINIAASSLQPNRTYYILVDNYPGSQCDYQFSLTGIPSTDAGADQSICESAAAFNLVGVPNGGQWFGPGITDATLGTFNPSVAGIGTQTVYYRVGNCTDSKVINVTGVDLQLPNDISICPGSSAPLSANAAPLPSTLLRTFSNNTTTAIPDANATGITSNVTVSGLTPNTVGTNPIRQVCLNISHPFDGDLDISLIAPNGTVINLSSDNGGSGDNYTNTCFVTGATAITTGTAPFTGNFAPEASLTGAGISASAVNGTWGLRVADDSGGDIGTLINWSIQFAQTNSMTYSWSPTTNMTNANTLSPTVSPTVNTTYTLTATDVTGCTASDAMVVSIVNPTVTITGNRTICPSGSTTLTASSSGTGTFLWSTGATTSSITVSPSATTAYAVTYNQGGCTATATATVTISAITLTDTNTSVTCNGGSNGSINLTVAGGTAPYTYNWGSITTEDRTGLTSGTYTVTVTDANSCTATRSVVIMQPIGITLTNTTTNVSCNGGSNGSINLTVAGGTSPYTYNWGSVTTEDRTGLAVGSYTVTVTDANSCTATRSITITQPTAITLTHTATSASCNGGTNGSIDLTAAGGTTPYTYNWGGGIVTEDRTGLAANTYTVTVTDANSCTSTRSIVVTQLTGLSLTHTSVNVSCNGGSNGSIDVTVAGGTTPYTYNWGGVTTEDRTSLIAGTYTVTVSDANLCSSIKTVTITQPTTITLTNTSVNVSCNGGSNGSIDVTVVGGTTPYTYNWGGIATEDRTGLIAGAYTVTVTDANSCTATRSITITQPTAITLTNTSVNINCNGGSTGSINLTAAGGTTPYTYNWGGVATEDRTGLIAGTYTVTVTDVNSCTATRSVTITQPTAITLTNTSVNVSCNNGSNGSIDLTAAGGTTPYTYNWGGITTEDRTGLIAGTYTVTVTDANSCTATRSVTITQPSAITLTNTSVNVNCNGGSNGSIDLTAAGGTTPYTYNWGGITTEDRTGLAVGTYTVLVTDANSCTATRSVTITQPTAITLTNTSVNVSCNNGSNGSIDLTATGGTTPYTYNWGGITTEDRTGLAAGTYTVTVTDANSCTATRSVTITQPTAITLTNTSVNTSCNGGSNGSIDLTTAGGTTPYTYNWGGITTEDRTSLVAGTYTVTVTDANSCTATRSVTITQPTAITISSVITNASCSNLNGAIDVTVTGGRTPYTYNWGGVTTEDRTGLAAGNYTVTVTDANACTSSQTFNLTTTVAVTATIVAPTRVLTCATTSIQLNASASIGGGSPLTYLWSTGEATSSIAITSPNTYRVTVTETSSGCQAVQSITITTDYLKPTITLTSSSPSITCNTQSVVLDASGSIGTGALSYVWSTGGTNAMVTVSSAGTYSVIATNTSNGCTATGDITILSDNTSPNIAISNSIPLLNCKNISSVLGVSLVNESFPISVSWSNGLTTTPITVSSPNTYSVTVTNLNNGCSARTSTTVTQDVAAPNVSISAPITQFTCSITRINLTAQSQLGALASFVWSTGSSVAIITATTVGVYQVTATNGSNFCTSVTAVTLTSNTTPPAIAFTSGIRELNCTTRTLNIDASSSTGLGALGYNWSTGQAVNNTNVTRPGVVTLTLTDSANGCTTTANQTVTENIQAPTSVITPSATVITCRTQLIELNANSSTPINTLSFLWSVNNDSRPAITIGNAGVYQLMVTNSLNGCTATSNQTITTVPNTLQASTATTPALCNGGSTGSATISTTGGTAPISYLWTTSQNTISITGLRAGDYQAVATDVNGCSVNVTATVVEPTALLLQAAEQPVLCNGDSNGSIVLSTNGGTPNYTYKWSNQQTTANLTGVSAANYCVTVTDAHGCQALTCMNVTTPQSVVITNTAVQNVTCFDANNGTIRVNVVGGTPNYTYNWSVPTSTNSSSITGLKPGNYSLNILDANGCKANQSFTITTPDPLQMTYTSTNLICYGDESGSINITQVTGGTAPYKFSIDGTNFSANKVYTNLEARSFNLYARDLNGCTYTSPNITLTQPSQIQVALTATKDTIELGDATTINARISGRPSNLTFLWSPKDSLSCTTCERNIVANPSHTTSYRLTVQSDKGCTAHKDITIFVNKNRSVYIPTGFTPNNDGINDAFMVYSAKGIKSIKTFRVFDRWGELLFENNNSKPNEPTSGWDGVFKNKAMIPDVYIYLIEIEFVDGYNQTYKGAVNLIH